MIKKFALLATVAALFVACSSENTEAMESSSTEPSSQEMLDAANADAEVVVAPETATEEVLIEESEMPAEEEAPLEGEQ
jgi:hypothetical protein